MATGVFSRYTAHHEITLFAISTCREHMLSTLEEYILKLRDRNFNPGRVYWQTARRACQGKFSRPGPNMGDKPEINLHVCCAPCLGRVSRAVSENGWRIGRLFFYNPNIHPLLEFRRRIKAVRIYLERHPLTAEIDSRYGLEDYLAAVMENGRCSGGTDRCFKCLLLRLLPTARKALELGMPGFSTTLLASREQDRDLVLAAGDEAAKTAGALFFTGDFRQSEPPEKDMKGIYRQQYCGCIFSESERYAPTGKHLYLPPFESAKTAIPTYGCQDPRFGVFPSTAK